MRIENIVALTYGKVVNNPFVSIFEDIVLDAKSVKRGDLFVAFCEDEIELAILNGAYGIIFDKPTQITDSEIAWIKVEDLDVAVKKLIRFRLVEKDVTAYMCDNITLQLANQIVTDSSFVVLTKELKISFKTLWNLPQKANVVFSPIITSSDIFTNIKKIPKHTKDIVKIVEQTLFEISFIYDEVFYERQSLSPIFLDNLLQVVNLLKKLKVNFKIKKLHLTNHFEAIFVNKNLQKKEFGSSENVVIFETDFDLLKKEMDFLTQKASWGRTIYILPKFFKNISNNYFLYEDNEDIFKILKNEQYNFALIFDKDKSILDNVKQTNKQLTLF